jgi:hypothetical protein
MYWWYFLTIAMAKVSTSGLKHLILDYYNTKDIIVMKDRQIAEAS